MKKKYMKKIELPRLFIFWSIVEFIVAGILYFKLPETIKINFGYILTSPVSQGNRAYIFTLPVVMFVSAIVFQALSRYYSPYLRYLLLVINVIVLLGTSFYLLQFLFM